MVSTLYNKISRKFLSVQMFIFWTLTLPPSLCPASLLIQRGMEAGNLNLSVTISWLDRGNQFEVWWFLICTTPRTLLRDHHGFRRRAQGNIPGLWWPCGAGGAQLLKNNVSRYRGGHGGQAAGQCCCSPLASCLNFLRSVVILASVLQLVTAEYWPPPSLPHSPPLSIKFVTPPLPL